VLLGERKRTASSGENGSNSSSWSPDSAQALKHRVSYQALTTAKEKYSNLAKITDLFCSTE
jgi:hypothetical protein